MTQSDYRMGWAPAVLCIEDALPRPVKPPLGYAYRGRTNDPFEVGDFGETLHLMNTGGTSCVREEDCMKGDRLASFVKAQAASAAAKAPSEQKPEEPATELVTSNDLVRLANEKTLRDGSAWANGPAEAVRRLTQEKVNREITRLNEVLYSDDLVDAVKYALNYKGRLHDLYLARLVEYQQQLMNSVCGIPTPRDLYKKPDHERSIV